MTESYEMTELPGFGRRILGFWGTQGVAARVFLCIGALICCEIFALAGRWFEIPALPALNGSLLRQPSSISALLVTLIVLVLGTLLGTILCGAIHFDAGLFVAAIGMMALSIRCGTIQDVLFNDKGAPGVYVTLAIELLILALFVAGIWIVLYRFARSKLRTSGASPELLAELEPSSISEGIFALIAQAVVMAIVVMCLCQSIMKDQALVSVAIGAIAGSAAAVSFAPARPSIWYWMGPVLVGVVGYILAACGEDAMLNIGVPTGTFAGLARPLPLDYASVGIAGAMLGYWIMREKA